MATKKEIAGLAFGANPDQFQEARSKRRKLAASDFEQARNLAETHGLFLVRRTDQHYQLTPNDDGWLLNLYPGNCRLYGDTNRPCRTQQGQEM